MYVRTFGEGGGEDGLHHHDDDALWFVYAAGQRSVPRDGVLLSDVGAHEGVVVPAGTSYRFVCTEPATLARVARAATTTRRTMTGQATRETRETREMSGR